MKKNLLLACLLSTTAAYAGDDLDAIQHQWADCEYSVQAASKTACLQQLSSQADKASFNNSTRADLLIWAAIVKSSWAGEKGGLGALDLVKDARDKLERAIKIDPNALQGSAYTSLGTLYYKVPGWPLGFGDDKQAEKLLKQALAINSMGIDPNFFYGDYLLEQGRKDEARVYLQRALSAAPRPGRELADQGRRREIHQRLDKL